MEENTQAVEVVTDFSGGITVRPPDVVLAEAVKAAKALKDVVSKKSKPVLFNGEQYLEFEDWQTLARFYGITAKVVSTTFVQYGAVQGFECRAEAISAQTGAVLSAADSMCLNDEDNWSSRPKYEWVKGVKTKVGEVPVPMFQLRSMAQTRACAKCLRNILAWVAVLAGYKPTPAEEMDGVHTNAAPAPAHQSPERKGPQAAQPTEAELKALADRAKTRLNEGKPPTEATKAPPAQAQVPPQAPKQAQDGPNIANGFIFAIHPENAGGYKIYELDNEKGPEGYNKRFATKNLDIIQTIEAHHGKGERVSFTYTVVPWKKGTKSGLNYSIDELIAEAQPGD